VAGNRNFGRKFYQTFEISYSQNSLEKWSGALRSICLHITKYFWVRIWALKPLRRLTTQVQRASSKNKNARRTDFNIWYSNRQLQTMQPENLIIQNREPVFCSTIFVKNRNFGQHSIIWSKIEILVKKSKIGENRNVWSNRNFGEQYRKTSFHLYQKSKEVP